MRDVGLWLSPICLLAVDRFTVQCTARQAVSTETNKGTHPPSDDTSL